MEYKFSPKGVCSIEMIFDIENNIINSLKIIGGCPGNTVGVSRLVAGKNIDEENEELQEEAAIPTIVDDGSIIYDGMTITELTDKLNRSLGDYLSNTGYYFAKYTRDTGMDPYLSVAIVLLETGCKWKCSSLTYECNNIGGLKGGNSCNGKSYSRYDTLEEGIDSYLNIIYNNYYLKGLDTPEKMGPKYAYSTLWAEKVNTYIKEIKEK